MHEMTLLVGLMKQIERIAREEKANAVSVVRVKLGALSHISPEHFREHFEHAALGTVAEGAVLEVTQLTDINDPNAQEILLESLDVSD
jgi:hydrogenase nickel incorporation protein HypA/HybF